MMNTHTQINTRQREILMVLGKLDNAKSQEDCEKHLPSLMRLLSTHASLIMEFIYPQFEGQYETEDLARCGHQGYRTIEDQVDELPGLWCGNAIRMENLLILRANMDDHFFREMWIVLPMFIKLLTRKQHESIACAMAERADFLNDQLDRWSARTQETARGRRILIRGLSAPV